MKKQELLDHINTNIKQSRLKIKYKSFYATTEYLQFEAVIFNTKFTMGVNINSLGFIQILDFETINEDFNKEYFKVEKKLKNIFEDIRSDVELEEVEEIIEEEEEETNGN